jgi:hypothetical protein
VRERRTLPTTWVYRCSASQVSAHSDNGSGGQGEFAVIAVLLRSEPDKEVLSARMSSSFCLVDDVLRLLIAHHRSDLPIFPRG